MKTVLDAETFRQLTVANMVSWLRATGWGAAPQEHERVVRFTKSLEDGVAEVEVPRRPDFRDFALRMAEVVDIAATIESRSPAEIVRDIRRTGVDSLHLRFDGGSARLGRVSAEGGALLFQSVRDLLLAGACSALEKRPLFARRKPDQAMQFLQHVRFAPPETGSFQVIVESPIIPYLNGQLSLYGEDPEPPFERRVMRTLALALEAAIRAAEQVSVNQQLAPFVQAIQAGVSANLCEALAGLLRSVEGSRLEARFAWARNRPLPEAVPGALTFFPETIPILEAVSHDLRAREPQPDFDLRGPILELASEDPKEGGTLTIGGALENRIVKIRVQVDGEVYSRALRAHEQKKGVLVEGELFKEGRSYVLRQARNFAIESDE